MLTNVMITMVIVTMVIYDYDSFDNYSMYNQDLNVFHSVVKEGSDNHILEGFSLHLGGSEKTGLTLSVFWQFAISWSILIKKARKRQCFLTGINISFIIMTMD